MQAKKIIVTGASRGLGFSLARLLVYQGHSVLAVARSREPLENLKKDCKGLKGSVKCLSADVSDTQTIVSSALQHLNSVDVLINNAAAFLKRDFLKLTKDDLQHLYNANVFAPLLLSQGLYSLYNNGAHIVNISSIGGVQGSLKFKELLPYSSSKGALNIITECLALELAHKNVYCNALALGSVATEMFKNAFPSLKAASSTADMAKYIGHFALNAAPLINGKVIPVSSSNP